MKKLIAAISGGIAGVLVAMVGLLAYLDWGTQGAGQPAHIDPTRADYVDLLLALVVILLAAVGLVVTVGALVIGLVALKTLREIKDEAVQAAQTAAVQAARTAAVQAAGTAAATEINKMAREGELNEVLDKVLAKVALRLQGGPEASEDEGN